jgi:hypothetical protein
MVRASAACVASACFLPHATQKGNPACVADHHRARADAQKIIGRDGQMPKFKGNLAKETAEANKCIHEITAAKDVFQDKLLAYKKALDAVKDTAQANRDDVEGTDFGLDPKDAKQKKQIKDAQDVICGALDDLLKECDVMSKVADEAYKNVAKMRKDYDALEGA